MILKFHPYAQVLDDSTDKATRDLVDDKVLEWRERGVSVSCVRRSNRAGYKAGALKEVPNFSACISPYLSLLFPCTKVTDISQEWSRALISHSRRPVMQKWRQ